MSRLWLALAFVAAFGASPARAETGLLAVAIDRGAEALPEKILRISYACDGPNTFANPGADLPSCRSIAVGNLVRQG